MKHLVFTEIAANNTSRNTPMQFSIVLAAEIMSKQTDSRIVAAMNHVVRIRVLAILFLYVFVFNFFLIKAVAAC